MAVKKALVLGTDGKPQQLQAGDTLAGAGGTPTITEVVVTAPYEVMNARIQVVDASISPSSKIQIGWGAALDTDENDPETTGAQVYAIPGAGAMTVVISSLERFGGAFRLNYLVG